MLLLFTALIFAQLPVGDGDSSSFGIILAFASALIVECVKIWAVGGRVRRKNWRVSISRAARRANPAKSSRKKKEKTV